MPGVVTDIVHFHNGKGGGVWSVISNLIRFSDNKDIRNHLIFTVNQQEEKEFIIPSIQGPASIQVFEYVPGWNFYHTCHQLKKLLPSTEAVIVAHDWLELGMVSNLGLKNPVVFFLHGDYDYYFELAKKHQDCIDKFITVSKHIQLVLENILPTRIKDIEYLRFPVNSLKEIRQAKTSNNIIFIGRLSHSKGYHLLPLIAEKVEAIYPGIHWHIVGEMPTDDYPDVVWESNIPVHFYGNISNDAVQELLTIMNFYILPSIAEGMPISLVEAMKAGVIPIVNNLGGGTAELIKDGETGYTIMNNDIDLFAQRIIELAGDAALVSSISANCKSFSHRLFHPHFNTAAIEACFLEAKHKPNKRHPQKIYGSRLDQPWLSNNIVYFLRKLFFLK